MSHRKKPMRGWRRKKGKGRERVWGEGRESYGVRDIDYRVEGRRIKTCEISI